MMSSSCESLDKFIQKELNSIKIKLSCEIEKTSDVDGGKLLDEISKLQGKPVDYYKSKDVYNFVWWVYEIHYYAKSSVMNEKITEMLNGSKELINEIKEFYPGAGVFHSKNISGFPVEHSNYFSNRIKDNQYLGELEKSCLKIIAEVFHRTYKDGDVFDGEKYQRYRSHRVLFDEIVACLKKRLTEFCQSEEFTLLINEMIQIELDYYKKRIRYS